MITATQRFCRHKVRISNERRPRTSDMNLIQQAIAVVLADDQKNGKWRREWTQEYGTNHLLRLAHDMALIRRFAKKSDKICEVGSLPPLLTIALKKEGFDVTGIDIAPERLASQFQEPLFGFQDAISNTRHSHLLISRLTSWYSTNCLNICASIRSSRWVKSGALLSVPGWCCYPRQTCGQ
jgi:hypothetical protein